MLYFKMELLIIIYKILFSKPSMNRLLKYNIKILISLINYILIPSRKMMLKLVINNKL